jgi:zinc-ribbon domain
MSTFCRNCGTSVSDTVKFCGKCGTPTAGAPVQGVPTNPPAASNAPNAAASSIPAASGPAASGQVAGGAAAGSKGLSTGAKIAIAAVVIIFVGGGVAVAGMAYAAHRVSQKFHAMVKGEVSGDDAPASGHGGGSSGSSASSGSLGNVCRYLSKEDVGAAIGVPIVRTESVDNGCNYYAKGDQAQMSAKHITAMMASKGADPKTQKMIEGMAGGLFQSFQAEKPDTSDGSGTIVVLNFSLDNNAAVEAMKLNRRAMQQVGGATTQDLPGVADEAFVTGDSGIIARKGDKLIRVMYPTCPCNTTAVEPLVQKLAAAL